MKQNTYYDVFFPSLTSFLYIFASQHKSRMNPCQEDVKMRFLCLSHQPVIQKHEVLMWYSVLTLIMPFSNFLNLTFESVASKIAKFSFRVGNCETPGTKSGLQLGSSASQSHVLFWFFLLVKRGSNSTLLSIFDKTQWNRVQFSSVQ